MDPLSPIPAVLLTLIAVATAQVLSKRFGVLQEPGRFASIDGLRGYLAFFVFLHHASIWYAYLRTGLWQSPPSHLYRQLGEASVSAFFMITGFLFFSKLLNSRQRGVDWLQLYVSRVLRLTPLYLFAVLGLILVVLAMTTEPISAHEWWKPLIKWITFTILGSPDLGGVANTPVIVAGVTWSLRYEWLFYCSLPLMALFIGIKPQPLSIAVGAFSLAWFASWQPQAVLLLPFAGGMAAALLIRSEAFCSVSKRPLASVLILLCVGLTIKAFASAYSVAPLVLLTVAFALIAGGNSLFGLLTWTASRFLGEMAYSIYLLHGLILFVSFKLILGAGPAAAFSAVQHWLLAAAITPVLICVCFASFTLIEQPAMRRVAPVTAGLVRLLSRVQGLFRRESRG